MEGNLSTGDAPTQWRLHIGQASNRRHQRVGHLFQGRFKGILMDKEAYLLELARYVVLNPVRAGRVDLPEQWPWSSYRAMMGKAPAPKWLAVEALLSQFGSKRAVPRRRYRRFVLDGMGQGLWNELRNEAYTKNHIGHRGYAHP